MFVDNVYGGHLLNGTGHAPNVEGQKLGRSNARSMSTAMEPSEEGALFPDRVDLPTLQV